MPRSRATSVSNSKTLTDRFCRCSASAARVAFLNNARLEGGLNPDPKYLHFQGMNSAGPNQFSGGEILLAPGQRSDVVLRIPPSAAPGDVLTIWTRDFQRGMGSDGANPLEHPPAGPCPAGAGNCGPNGYSLVPTVPVLHLRVQAGTSPASTLAVGTPLLSATGNYPVQDLRSATISPLLTPSQAGQPVGTSNPRIELDMGNSQWDQRTPHGRSDDRHARQQPRSRPRLQPGPARHHDPLCPPRRTACSS